MAMRGAGVELKRAELDLERQTATLSFDLTLPAGGSLKLPVTVQGVTEITVEEQKRAAKWLQELFASWSESAALYADAPYMGRAAAAREAESEAEAERGGG